MGVYNTIPCQSEINFNSILRKDSLKFNEYSVKNSTKSIIRFYINADLHLFVINIKELVYVSNNSICNNITNMKRGLVAQLAANPPLKLS